MRGYTLLHLSRETVGASTTFSARYYSYDVLVFELCGKISMSAIRTQGGKRSLSDLLDKHLSTVIANGGVISAQDFAASRYLK